MESYVAGPVSFHVDSPAFTSYHVDLQGYQTKAALARQLRIGSAGEQLSENFLISFVIINFLRRPGVIKFLVLTRHVFIYF